MVKFFDRKGKFNWVDENNVVVGFDSSSLCCESFGYFYSKVSNPTEAERIDEMTARQLEDYHFDTSFFEDGDVGGDVGGTATFKMVNSDGEALYLTVHNSHNGYYSHGFDMFQNGLKIHAGDL